MRVSIKSIQWISFFCFVAILFTAWGLQSYWFPSVKRWAANQIADGQEKKGGGGDKDDHAEDDHAGHDHAGHDESSSLELSAQARKNVGLTKGNVLPVKLQTFTRTISVPAIVVERPGRTRIKIVASMTGIVTNISIIAGEAILPGRELFNLRLTHEDMVQAQATFLKTLGALDVEKKEIARLEKITGGGVARKVLLAREYAKEKLDIDLSAQREALYLHGFSKEQVDRIASKRRLLKSHQIFAPELHNESGEVRASNDVIRRISTVEESRSLPKTAPSLHTYIVQELTVNKGDFVSAGDTLCVLADYRELYIQGRAFEHDAEELTRANNKKWNIQAVLENRNKEKMVIDGLEIAYLDNQIESQSRAFHFYVNLPNKILGDTTTSDGHRFLTWQFKPGQRLQLRVPVEKWGEEKKEKGELVFVLPVDAIATEGADRFVFQENGDHFDRKPVHVLYQDQLWVVIANDGSIFPDDVIARTGAHQMQMALKNKAGGGVDPHAGHNH